MSKESELSYKYSLFDSLGIANKERIHTQFLCWFFNHPHINDQLKAFFINGILAKIPNCMPKEFNPEYINKIEAETEVKINSHTTKIKNKSSIDLIIKYKIKDQKYVMAFENKLKSTVHSNQLDNYNAILKADFPEPEYSVDKFLLSLIGEMPKGNDDWNVITYKDINYIFNIIQKTITNTNNEKIFVDEYIQTLDNLLLAKERFFENPLSFKNIHKYEDCNKTNEDLGSDWEFISKNKLRTILMINYLMDHEQFKYIICRFDKPSYAFTETRGTALFQIKIAELKVGYTLQFQYQSCTVKLQIFPTKDGDYLPKSLLEDFFPKGHQKRNTWRINKAKNGKNTYISLSKKLLPDSTHFENVRKAFDNIYNNKDQIIDILSDDNISDKKDKIIDILLDDNISQKKIK